MRSSERQSWRTLVVDDDPGVRSAVASVVSAAGHEPLVAATCAEAWRHVQAAPVQATFVDLHIRQESGLTLASELLALGRIRVILMSGDLSLESRARALSLGVHRILEKPLTLPTLRRTLSLHWPWVPPWHSGCDFSYDTQDFRGRGTSPPPFDPQLGA